MMWCPYKAHYPSLILELPSLPLSLGNIVSALNIWHAHSYTKSCSANCSWQKFFSPMYRLASSMLAVGFICAQGHQAGSDNNRRGNALTVVSVWIHCLNTLPFFICPVKVHCDTRDVDNTQPWLDVVTAQSSYVVTYEFSFGVKTDTTPTENQIRIAAQQAVIGLGIDSVSLALTVSSALQICCGKYFAHGQVNICRRQLLSHRRVVRRCHLSRDPC